MQQRELMRLRWRRLVLWTVGCGIVAASTSCSADGGSAAGDAPQSWDEVVEAASDEGPVVWYTANREPTIEAVKEAFAEDHPDIELEVTRLVGADLMSRLDQERQNDLPGFTVVSTDALSLSALAQDGDILPLTDLPAFAAAQDVYDDDAYVGPDDMYALGSGELVGIMWNTDRVKDDIDDYSDWVERADEFGDGRLGVTPVNNSAYASFVIGIEEGIDGKPVLGDGDTCCREPEYLAELAELEPLVYASGVPLGNAVASGEIAAGWLVGSATYDTLVEQGAPVDFTESTEAPFSSNHFTAVRSGTDAENATKVFVDWMLDKDAGQAVIASTGTLPLYADLPGAPGDINQMVPPRDIVEDAAFMSAYNDRFENLFGNQTIE